MCWHAPITILTYGSARSLIEKVTGTVRWRESVDTMVKTGCHTVFDIGPAKCAQRVVQRIDDGASGSSVGRGPNDMPLVETGDRCRASSLMRGGRPRLFDLTGRTVVVTARPAAIGGAIAQARARARRDGGHFRNAAADVLDTLAWHKLGERVQVLPCNLPV